jgi:TetR/AcrR family transcriptional regulator, cholesterol catabolism regulator
MFHLRGKVKHVSLRGVFMKDPSDKIIDVAIALAEKGGFDNVRQRDVAARAGVALGTLYKRFRSKEDILCAALEREAALLERRMEDSPVRGEDAIDRVTAFFKLVTRGFMRKPNYARAVIRAMSSGVPETAANVLAYHGRMNGLVIAALRGTGRLGYAEATASPPSKRESTLALMLTQIWFAALVGWSAGMFTENEVIEQVRRAAQLLTRALEE